MALRHRLRQPYLIVVSRESHDKGIPRCIEILSKSSAFSSVRSVTVQGTLLPTDEYQRGQVPESSNIHQGKSGGDLNYWLATTVVRLMESLNLFPILSMLSGHRFNLLIRLLELRDMTGSCVALFSPCLLDILHRAIPRCRLNIMVDLR